MSIPSTQRRNILCSKKPAYAVCNKTSQAAGIVTSIVLAVIMLSGIFYAHYEDTDISSYIKGHIILSLVLFCAAAFICFFVLRLIYKAMSNINQGKMKEAVHAPGRLLTCWGSIIICWLPYLIICYPASSMGWDYTWQLLQGSGVMPLTNHHPVLGSLIYGLLYKIGFVFGGAYGGLFFTDLFQVLLMSFSMAFALTSVRKMGCPKTAGRLLLIYTCLCPVFASHAVWLIKDSIYSSLVVLTFTLCLNISEENARRIMPLLLLVTAAVSATMYRSEAIIVTGFLFLAMIIRALIAKKRFYIKRVGLTAFSFISVFCLMKIVISGLDIPQTSMSRESLTICSAQIVNYLRKYPDEVTDEEMIILQDSYTDLEGVIEAYNDTNRDPLKTEDMNTEEMLKYLKTWMNLGCRHPGDYIDTFLRGTLGYWSPFRDPALIVHTTPLAAPEEDFANDGTRNMSAMNSSWLKMTYEAYGLKTDKTIGEFVSERNPDLNGLFSVKSAFPDARNRLKETLDSLKEIPVVNLIFLPGFYLIICIVSLGYLYSVKKGVFIQCLPIMLIVILAGLSPVNGYMRYFLPVAMCSLSMLGLCFTDPQS